VPSARLVRTKLPGDVPAETACLLVRGDANPVALTGDWAGGGTVVASEPVRVASATEDPFALLDDQPAVDGDLAGAVGGGWFGWLGYGLGASIERLPPVPPRPAPMPPFALAFYDHVLRLDPAGCWWFEALWTREREGELRRRLEVLRQRLAAGVAPRAASLGAMRPASPGAAGHTAAVAACRERIAAGEIFQANVCLQLAGELAGDPIDLFASAARELRPRYGAFVGGPWGAVCSLSPELFLRRSGRRVVSEPIKGTAPRGGPGDDGARAALAASAKDRAENVMIVDVMRNDLGRVCEYGSVAVPALIEPRPAPGVWHLVSTVSGVLREETSDADLLRASFPPASVTGAPKIQAMRVIAELESTGREAYTGAIGYASPAAGLELNVAIRTIEVSGERAWLGVGGGIVADSDPALELEECFVKARATVAAAGGRVDERRGRAEDRPGRADDRPGRAPRAAAPFALGGAADRPDPAMGVFSTLLVRDGVVVDAEAHLERLRESAERLWGQTLPDDIDLPAGAAAARLRVVASPRPGEVVAVEVQAEPLDLPVAAAPVALAPFVLPGGLGEHKWRDRRLLDSLAQRSGAVPLIVDLDGEVLEAAHANVFLVEGGVLVTAPLDGRQLPGTARARLIAAMPGDLEVREEAVTLERLAAADEVLLTSSLRGVHAASPRFEVGARLAGLAGRRLVPHA
jgi:para-aminobenzoate synthetase/4-amino-4-deoxychorismate lyase